MESVKKYHIGDHGLTEGEAPGWSTVYLAADFDRVSAENLALQQRVDELEGLLRQCDDFMYIMTGNDTQRDLDAKYGRLLWEDAIVNLRGRIATALNPTAEAVSHDR